MTDDTASDTKTAYPKTGLIVAATVLPVLGWAFKQVVSGVKNGFEGKDNSSNDED